MNINLLNTNNMTLRELNSDQTLRVKQSILSDRDNNVSLGELMAADELVSDSELEEIHGGTEFVEDDF